MSSEIANLRTSVVGLLVSMCRQRCEMNFNSCVQAAATRDIQDRIQVGPSRGPAKFEIPGCWPFDCSDDEKKEAVSKPMPSCSKYRDACLVACPAAP